MSSVLGRTRRGDDRRIDDGAGLERHAAVLQHPARFGKQALAQLVLLQQMTELEQGGRIRHRFASQVDAGKAPQAGAVVERFLAGQIGQVEPVLQKVDAQHALQPDRRPAVARLRVVRLDHRAQRFPRHDPVHRLQKLIAPRRLAVLLETLVLRHRQGLLFHRRSPDRLSMTAYNA